MRIRMSTSGPTLRVQADGMRNGLSKAVAIAIAGAAEGAKEEMRRDLAAYRGAFGRGRMGRVVNAIQAKIFPKPPRHSLSAAAIIYARGEQAQRIMTAFAEGPTIRAKSGGALAIPLHQHRGVDGQLIGPRSSYWGKSLTFIPSGERGGVVLGILAQERRGGRPSERRRERNSTNRKRFSDRLDFFQVPQFILVKAVKHPRVLNPTATTARWAARVPGLVQQALASMGNRG